MITKKIIWFFGPSCAGKATTIERIMNNDQGLYSEIIELYSLQRVIKCDESFIKSLPREDLVSTILNKYNLLDIEVLLIKGQTTDLNMMLPQNLRRQLSNVPHEIVFLWVSPEELNRRRLGTRHTDYWKGWGIGNHMDELRLQVQKVSKLVEENFPVFWVYNTGNLPEILTYNEVMLRTEKLK